MLYRFIDPFRLKRWIVIGLSAVCCLVFSPVLSQSIDNSSGLTIIPAIIDQSATAGIETSLSLTLTNDSSDAALVTARIEPFLLINDQLASGADEDRFDITSWLKLPVDSWVLASGESKPVVVSVFPRPDASPGSYYSQAVFRLMNQTSSEASSTTKVTPEVTALLFLTVPGRQFHAIVTDLADIPRFVIGSGLTLNVIATNHGNTHEIVSIATRQRALLAPNGQFRTASQPFSMILPDTSKTITLRYSFAGLLNKYEIAADLSFGMPVKSSTTKPIEVWVVSVWAIVIAIAILSLMAVGLRFYLIKRRIKFISERRISPPRRLKRYRVKNRNDGER